MRHCGQAAGENKKAGSPTRGARQKIGHIQVMHAKPSAAGACRVLLHCAAQCGSRLGQSPMQSLTACAQLTGSSWLVLLVPASRHVGGPSKGSSHIARAMRPQMPAGEEISRGKVIDRAEISEEQ